MPALPSRFEQGGPGERPIRESGYREAGGNICLRRPPGTSADALSLTRIFAENTEPGARFPRQAFEPSRRVKKMGRIATRNT